MTRKKPAIDEKATGLKAAGIDRRGFITSCSVSTVALAVSRGGWAAGETPQPDVKVPANELTPIQLKVNGKQQQLRVEPRWSLLYVLREQLGLTAAKIGCERGECGSCTVLLDDIPHYACMTLAIDAQDQSIETAEGLMEGKSLGQVQQSFVKEDGLQCGYCTPGQVMAAEGLLRANPDPDLDEIRRGMSGNLCRCGAYDHIFKAVADAAKQRKA